MSAQYSVIRYVPDPGRGESLNVGILVWDEDEFRLDVDEKAIARVIRENPRLERDSLFYVAPLLQQQLSSAVVPVSSQITNLLKGQRGFPIELSEPRFTKVDPTDEGGLDATLERLTHRVVTPRRRSTGRTTVRNTLERRLKPMIQAETVYRNHFFGETKTGVPRMADFFANSTNNVALDVVRLAVSRADEVRQRADAEAFKVYDVLEADSVVREYVVLCEFAPDKQLAETNEHARRVIETQGARVVTDIEDAVTALGGAAS
jgi:hypothetical protein